MVTSILHRATGIALAAGTILLLLALLALASGPEAWNRLAGFCDSWFGRVLLFGWIVRDLIRRRRGQQEARA